MFKDIWNQILVQWNFESCPPPAGIQLNFSFRGTWLPAHILHMFPQLHCDMCFVFHIAHTDRVHTAAGFWLFSISGLGAHDSQCSNRAHSSCVSSTSLCYVMCLPHCSHRQSCRWVPCFSNWARILWISTLLISPLSNNNSWTSFLEVQASYFPSWPDEPPQSQYWPNIHELPLFKSYGFASSKMRNIDTASLEYDNIILIRCL